MALPSFARFAALASAAVLALGGPVGADVAPSPSPSASGIETGTPVIPDGTYRYLLFRKPFPDANVEITVANSAAGTTVHVTIPDYYEFLYAPVTIQSPYTWQREAIAMESTLVLTPSLDPVSYAVHDRSVPCCDYVSNDAIAITPDGAVFSPVVRLHRPGPLKVSLIAGTSHFVVLDMSKPSTAFILPFVLNAWHTDRVTVVSPQDWQQGTSYVLHVDSPDTRPKGVPASDVAYHLDGPLGLTAWVDPSNLLADRIDLPGAQTTVVRVGTKY